ncbi:efflux RND transporter periplasmic adaptor subunit [Larkinella humicola]|uniref:Efflux RND transporter periplasmic adaptor subunit n=1 Tax=Larkinella humicola TaxID=2607654 RepID=A0A5N1J6Z2_9BACT|nr:efflux RND transporter periplasmic adaptor subunit [Larkinella humicola]KAA9340383.1 efflux RND transporter periplasmic adaptor subunit [Larkinella humicola]
MKQTRMYPIFALLLAFSACQPKTAPSENTPETALPVVTTRAGNVAARNEISISGNIEGNKTVRLGFMVAGKINYIAASEGQLVSKGQLLSSLDPTNYGIAKEMADVQVNQVQDEYNRLKLMYDRKSISESDFSKVNFGLQQAHAQQKLQAKNLADTKLYAPISGVMLKKLAEVGEITGVGTPLFVVSDIRTVKVNAYIPESELHRIKLGQQATVLVSSLNETFTGKVIEVGSAADATSRAFTIKIELPNPRLLIRPGMIAEVKILSSQLKNRLALPAEAVLHDLDNQSYVYVVAADQNKAFKRKVSVGQLINNQIEITSGLAENETVVTGGQQKLNDGSLISIAKN